jgi:hypothetical protein
MTTAGRVQKSNRHRSAEDPHADPDPPRPAAGVTLPQGIVIGLGTVWILGLEVTIAGATAARLTQRGSA